MNQAPHAMPESTHQEGVIPSEGDLDSLRLRLATTWYWRQDAQWRFVQVDEVCDCMGIRREDWLGHTLWNTPNCMAYDFWDAHRQDLLAQRSFRDLQFEIPEPADAASTLWLQISGEPILDAQGGVTGYHGFGRDVTAQKRMELALRGRELRLRAIFEQSPLAIIEWDTRLRVRRWNLAAEKIFGWTREEILGRHARILSHPSRHHLYGEMGHELVLGLVPSKHVAQNLHKLGHELPCSWTTSMLHDDHGKVMGAISVVENLTERKLAESLMLTAVATLYKVIAGKAAPRTVDLGALRAAATPTHRALPVLLGAVIGALVTLTSVGAGAIGVLVLMLLYPALPLPRIVGADIAHAVPLTLVAGLGHASIGSVDWSLLALLLAGSLPGIWLGSHLMARTPERLIRSLLSVLLAYAGAKLIAL